MRSRRTQMTFLLCSSLLLRFRDRTPRLGPWILNKFLTEYAQLRPLKWRNFMPKWWWIKGSLLSSRARWIFWTRRCRQGSLSSSRKTKIGLELIKVSISTTRASLWKALPIKESSPRFNPSSRRQLSTYLNGKHVPMTKSKSRCSKTSVTLLWDSLALMMFPLKLPKNLSSFNQKLAELNKTC